jgi:hypothetical protein
MNVDEVMQRQVIQSTLSCESVRHHSSVEHLMISHGKQHIVIDTAVTEAAAAAASAGDVGDVSITHFAAAAGHSLGAVMSWLLLLLLLLLLLKLIIYKAHIWENISSFYRQDLFSIRSTATAKAAVDTVSASSSRGLCCPPWAVRCNNYCCCCYCCCCCVGGGAAAAAAAACSA